MNSQLLKQFVPRQDQINRVLLYFRSSDRLMLSSLRQSSFFLGGRSIPAANDDMYAAACKCGHKFRDSFMARRYRVSARKGCAYASIKRNCYTLAKGIGALSAIETRAPVSSRLRTSNYITACPHATTDVHG